ncbi:hypothetical protein N656DRAFT_489763 [Canariomyces notabilis]|uniref:Uncharacterized protein n=1 Tax=Canariomyces notabilis TaxID=2074819 RepID=A0AAN6YV54_9PEZI|nr:hypothetical protein N656DRAFT_489763 [Canariomyces arenarius]
MFAKGRAASALISVGVHCTLVVNRAEKISDNLIQFQLLRRRVQDNISSFLASTLTGEAEAGAWLCSTFQGLSSMSSMVRWKHYVLMFETKVPKLVPRTVGSAGWGIPSPNFQRER